MAEAAAMAAGIIPTPTGGEERDQMGQMSTAFPRESSHGFTRGPSFDLEYVHPSFGNIFAAAAVAATVAVAVTATAAAATKTH